MSDIEFLLRFLCIVLPIILVLAILKGPKSPPPQGPSVAELMLDALARRLRKK